MWLDPRAMPNSSDTWKTGERVVKPGSYQCIDCRERGSSTVVTLAADLIFPYCTVCDIKDNTYKYLGPSR